MEGKNITVLDILLMKKQGRKITKPILYIENSQDNPIRIPSKISRADP